MKTGEPFGLLLSITATGASSRAQAGSPFGLLLSITQAQIGPGTRTTRKPGRRATLTVDARKTAQVEDD